MISSKYLMQRNIQILISIYYILYSLYFCTQEAHLGTSPFNEFPMNISFQDQ